MCAKKLVRYKNVNGVLVKQYESPALIDGLVDISQLPIVGAMGSAVIESGENANGRWVKWADGTMICTKSASTDNVSFSEWYNIYERNPNGPQPQLGSFPATFVDIPAISISGSMSGPLGDWYSMWIVYGRPATRNAFPEITISRPSMVSAMTVTLYGIAIGRWK